MVGYDYNVLGSAFDYNRKPENRNRSSSSSSSGSNRTVLHDREISFHGSHHKLFHPGTAVAGNAGNYS